MRTDSGHRAGEHNNGRLVRVVCSEWILKMDSETTNTRTFVGDAATQARVFVRLRESCGIGLDTRRGCHALSDAA